MASLAGEIISLGSERHGWPTRLWRHWTDRRANRIARRVYVDRFLSEYRSLIPAQHRYGENAVAWQASTAPAWQNNAEGAARYYASHQRRDLRKFGVILPE